LPSREILPNKETSNRRMSPVTIKVGRNLENRPGIMDLIH
jgi:hypothetical protein